MPGVRNLPTRLSPVGLVGLDSYREVAWLENYGGAYVLLPNGNYTGIDVMIQPNYNAGTSVYGSVGRLNIPGGSRADTIRYRSMQGYGLIVQCSKGGVVNTGIDNTVPRRVVVNGLSVAVDGVEVGSFTSGWNTQDKFANKPFALFGCYVVGNGSVRIRSNTRIGTCKLYTGTGSGRVLAYDLIPVLARRGPAMYDKLSGMYFYNVGADGFSVGPEIR